MGINPNTSVGLNAPSGEPSTGMMDDVPPRAAGMALMVIFLVGLALRLFRLDALPPWNDECIQLAGVKLPTHELVPIHLNGIDHMPPGSYLIQRLFWLAGHSTWAARLPGALCGAGMIPLAYWLVRRRTDRAGGLIAAALTATSFYCIYYSQELRAYAFTGLGYMLFLGLWMERLSVPITERDRSAGWMLFVAVGWLCGGLHFGILALLPAVALVSAAWIGVAAWRRRRAGVGREVARRLLFMSLSLALVFAGVYLLMGLSLGPKLKSMADGTGFAGWPAWSDVKDLVLRFTWGRGWRLWLLAGLMAAGILVPGRARACAWMAALLGGLTLLLAVAVLPRFGARGLDPEMSARYLMWVEWCVRLLAACGAWSLARFMARPRHRWAVLGIATLFISAGVQAQVLSHYYRMDCKWNPVRAVSSFIEARREPVLLALASIDDLHNMVAVWPRNATPLIPRVLDQTGTDAWMTAVAERHPEAIIRSSVYFQPSPDVRARLERAFLSTAVFAPNRHAQWLEQLGVKPLRGVNESVRYNTVSDIQARVAQQGTAIAVYSPALPIAISSTEDNAFILWRELREPAEITVYAPPAYGPAVLEIPAARLKNAVRVEWSRADESGQVMLGSARTMAWMAERGGWIPLDATAADIASLDGQYALRIATEYIRIPLPAGDGRRVITLRPMADALLLGYPQVSPVPPPEKPEKPE